MPSQQQTEAELFVEQRREEERQAAFNRMIVSKLTEEGAPLLVSGAPSYRHDNYLRKAGKFPAFVNE